MFRKKFATIGNKRRYINYKIDKEVSSALIFMCPLTIKSSGRGLIKERGSVIYLTVSHSIIGYGGRDLRQHNSSNTDYLDHRVIAVTQSQ